MKRFWFWAFAALFAFGGNVEAQDSRRSGAERTFVPEDEEFAKQQFAFALNLYRGALEGDAANANVLVAPFSACRCLNALSFGSAGRTKAEIDAALARDAWSDERWSETFGDVDRLVNLTSETTLAGALWFAPDLKLDEAFVDRCEKMARTEASTFDFKAPNALKKANAWFEKNADGKIKGFLSELDPETRLLIADATNFKAQWLRKFDEGRTRTRYFTNAQGEKIPVATMEQTARFTYCDAGEFQYLEAAYKNGRFALAIVLPKDYRSFSEVERSLTPTLFFECRKRAKFAEVVEFRLPKFKVERSFDLAATLKKAGVVSAFEDGADFARMTADGEAGRRENLKVDQAKQAAFLSVDENGTEAAATAVMTATGVAAPGNAPPPPPKFYADRPFFYFLRDNTTGAVLFAGRLVDPEPSGTAEDAEAAEKADAERRTPSRLFRYY
ncbi:MAG: serpin family protein [Thermoguttaceae bacterium]|nr:serpin family protein [Thermoguttaceae bacterium]